MSDPSREEELLAEIAELKRQLSASQAVSQSGSGGLAQGDRNVVSGAGGISIGHDFHGNIYQGKTPANDAEALAVYRRMILGSIAIFSCAGLTLGPAIRGRTRSTWTSTVSM